MFFPPPYCARAIFSTFSLLGTSTEIMVPTHKRKIEAVAVSVSLVTCNSTKVLVDEFIQSFTLFLGGITCLKSISQNRGNTIEFCSGISPAMSSTMGATLYRQYAEDIGKNGVEIVEMSNFKFVVMFPCSDDTGFIQ